MFCWIGAGYSLVTIATANIFIPLFHKLELTSTYEVKYHLFDLENFFFVCGLINFFK